MSSRDHAVALCWFRRSIRLDDNRSLRYAVENAGEVVPFFVLDPAILKNVATGKARTAFLFESLVELDVALRERGGRLIIRHGNPADAILGLVEETGATLLTFGREYEPFGRERDGTVEAAMNRRGRVVVKTFADHLITEPGEIVSRSNTPYTVFTPYKRVWFEGLQSAGMSAQIVEAPERIPVPENIVSDAIPALRVSEQSPQIVGGEATGRKLLDDFVRESLANYDSARDLPALPGTSRLSAYLRMGVVSARRVVQAARDRRGELEIGRRGGADTWLSEIAWRDFYYQILYHFPHVATRSFRPEYDKVAWENNDEYFLAWCEGRTGFPIVDAAMRQLNTEAWMHNRARMIVASFLCKDLLNDWRRGELYFMQKLIDGDLAPNNGGWQWSAGTGTDAQPFFRIFNPMTQGEKFDPDGAYVKRWVPELARVPAKFVHRPWELSLLEQQAVGCVLGRDYPRPIVDHGIQRERALAMYRAVSGEGNSESSN